MYQLLGGKDVSSFRAFISGYISSVLEFNVNTTEWSQIGAMTSARAYHAISTVPYNKILDSCIFPTTTEDTTEENPTTQAITENNVSTDNGNPTTEDSTKDNPTTQAITENSKY